MSCLPCSLRVDAQSHSRTWPWDLLFPKGGTPWCPGQAGALALRSYLGHTAHGQWGGFEAHSWRGQPCASLVPGTRWQLQSMFCQLLRPS